MRTSGRAVIGGAMVAWGLFASASSFADALDARLLGAWATSEADCKKLFVRSGGGIAYRQPVDKFAQAAIIGPGQIRAPASVCRVQHISHANGVIKLSSECNDSISYTQQTAQIKVQPGGEIVYSPTGDPALDTTLIKCAM